jgi:tRNA 2-thiocytidine biosynthesis protein TtcA
MQRVAVKKMLEAWEQQFPGRTESIFSAIRSVEVEHLADSRRFDFAGLDALRAAFPASAPAPDTGSCDADA